MWPVNAVLKTHNFETPFAFVIAVRTCYNLSLKEGFIVMVS